MNQNEFLKRLQEALGNDLSGQAVQENVNYYKGYIESEKKAGKREEDVIAELGDPWVIARGIVDVPIGVGKSQNYGDKKPSQSRKKTGDKFHLFPLDVWWKKVLLVMIVVVVIGLVFSIVTGIIRLIAPFVIPVVVIGFVIRLLGQRK